MAWRRAARRYRLEVKWWTRRSTGGPSVCWSSPRNRTDMTQNGSSDHIADEEQRWLSGAYAKAVEKGGERKDTDFRTSSTESAPIYTPADTSDVDYGRDVGYPGEFPFTRGVQ